MSFTGSGSCPQCNVPLRRNNFRIQLFEDPQVEKEVDIRRRILRDYNKREEDFDSLEQYNDYLEEIEILIFNLCNDLDIIETNRRIEQYKKDNREVIMKNKSKMSRDEYELQVMLDMEKQIEDQRKQELQELEKESKKKKLKEKEALIDELQASTEDANKILTAFAEQAEKLKEEAKFVPPVKPVSQFSTGIQFGSSITDPFIQLPKIDEGPLYVHEPLIINNEGPAVPSPAELENKGFLKNVRTELPVERAGGYLCHLACQRAMQEAMQGLYHGCLS